jgi:hypothetical protein
LVTPLAATTSIPIVPIVIGVAALGVVGLVLTLSRK